MAFTNNVISVARDQGLAIALETTPGVQVPANDASLKILMTNGAGSISQEFKREDDPQFRNTRSRVLPITEAFEAGKWSFPSLLKTRVLTATGTPVAGETDNLFTCAFGLPANGVAGSGKTATADDAWLGANTRVFHLLGTSAGGTVYPSFTAWFRLGHTAYYITGATVNQAEFNIAGDALVTCAWSGEFMRHGWAGTDVIVTAGAGSITVQDARKYFIADPLAGDTLVVDAVNPTTFAVTAAGIVVTAIDYTTNTLTVTGGGGTAGDLLVPHITIPAEDTTLLPLYGKYQEVKVSPFVDFTNANLPAVIQLLNSAKVTLTNGIKYYTNIKDNTKYPNAYAAPSFRDVKGEISMYMYRDLPTYNYKNQVDVLIPDYLMVPAGDQAGTAGRLFELHMPRCTWDTPALSGDDEKVATIGFRATATSAYNDELTAVFRGGTVV